MSGMYGADVVQLRQLASRFDQAADRLDQDRMTVGNAIRVAAWVGPVAVRFRLQWDSEHSTRLSSASSRLREASLALRRNADDQERTSAVDSGGALGGATAADSREYSAEESQLFEQLLEHIKLLDTVNGTLGDGGDLIAALKAGKIDLKSFSEWAGKVKRLDAGTILSLAGMGVTAKELGEAIGSNDPAATLEASLDLVMGAAGIRVPVAGFAWDLGKMMGETGYNSLQIVYDSPSSALDYAARSMYGDDVTFDSLEQGQRDVVMTRYEGMLGLVASAGDHWNGWWSDVGSYLKTGDWRGPR